MTHVPEHQHTDLCHCGTYEEATEAAAKQIAMLVGTDCMVWALGVATAMKTISIELLATDYDRKRVQDLSNRIVEHVKKNVNLEEVIEQARQQHTKLYGDET